MGFFSLSSAWLFALLAPLIVFYFLKLRRPRVELPSLALWRSVINDQRVNSPFQKFRRNLLLLLQILLLVLLCTAAMQPYLVGGPQRLKYLPILIDVSASMAATGESDRSTRLEAAKQQVRSLIDSTDRYVSLVAFSSTPQRLTDFTDNRQVLHDALNKLTVTDLPSKTDDALRLIQAMARAAPTQSPVEQVLMYTDGNVPDAVDFDLPFSLQVQLTPPAGPNVGITALNARRTKDRKWEVFARIDAGSGGGTATAKPTPGDPEQPAKPGEEASAGPSISAEVVLIQDGKESPPKPIRVSVGKSVRLTFVIAGGQASQIQLQLRPEGTDSLASDNVAYLDLPALRPLTVFARPELNVFRHALRVLKDINVFPADDGSGTAIRYDLVISDRVDDANLDAQTYFFVGVIPPDLEKLVGQRTKLCTVVDWQRSAALLQHVQLSDVQAAEEPYSLDNIRDGDFEQLGYEILIHGRSGPVLLQKRMGPKQAFYLLFHTDKSTLPYRVGFPVMVANLVNSSLSQAALSETRAAATGLFPPEKFRAGIDYMVTSPDGRTQQVRSNDEALLLGVATPKVGVYTVSENADEAGRVGVSLLNTRETSLVGLPLDNRGRPFLQFRETKVQADSTDVKADRPLWQWLSLGAFVMLLVEWWFFQRRPG